MIHDRFSKKNNKKHRSFDITEQFRFIENQIVTSSGAEIGFVELVTLTGVPFDRLDNTSGK